MGVHYFYTWVTRRYPLFKRTYDPETMPNIDNFYLDLNGVLYKCAKDDKALYRDIIKGKNMDEIFASIFNYINHLVNHMKPKKRIVIAIDGVAPRAKMNNQRQRRYHSARANKSLNDFLTGDLHTSPGVISFKNNSISPGTEFMFDLIDKVKFFVERKIHEDDNWKNIEVVFSGGDVPGEGEHKIMEWIRGWKQSKEYDINESHCIYSNDADLVFLGLSTHLPKMLILRESQSFDDDKVNSATKRDSKETPLELLYINLLREYMELEYQMDRSKYKHQFDIERIIDDFILVSFFIGNDFLHQLYCMSTKMGNFDEMIEIFKQTLPTLGGYLSHNGVINWANFLVFLKNIKRLEGKMIKTTYDEMRDILRQTKTNKKILFNDVEREEMDPETAGIPLPTLVLRRDNSGYEGNPEDIQSDSEDEKAKILEAEAKNFDQISPDSKSSPNSKASQESGYGLKKVTKNFEIEMQLYYVKVKNESEFIGEMHKTFQSEDPLEIKAKKLEFYKRFFGLNSLEEVDTIGLAYIKGLQFVMYYYFQGCPSWTWYYPYFISPFLSDLVTVLEKHVTNIHITFELGKPYRPYDQLAYILPKASFSLLPTAYQDTLLHDARSQRYYPEKLDEFEPFDGIHDYQWIAKLELFDDNIMGHVLSSIDQNKMSAEERKRNCVGQELLFSYSPAANPVAIKSIIKGLPDFTERIQTLPYDILKAYPFDPAKISSSQDGVDKDDGFPSLHIIPGVEGYMMEVRKKYGSYKRLILKFYSTAISRPAIPNLKYVFYDYPFKKIGFVNSVVNPEGMLPCGNLPPEVITEIVRRQNLVSNAEIYQTVAKDSLTDLYNVKGIDYDTEGMPEIFYSLEYRKSAWRTATDIQGSILYEFEHVPSIYPQGLILPFDLKVMNSQDTQFKFPTNEREIFVPGLPIVSLFNGDFLKISDPQPKDDPINIFGDIIKPNNNLSKEVVTAADLLEDRWDLVDIPTLQEFGLDPSQILILYGLMDSMVIKTDLSKTSSLLLGSLFDIGLKYFRALGQSESRVLIVIDLVRLSKAVDRPSQCAIPIKRWKGDPAYYEVYLSPKGKTTALEFFKTFPEIIEYMKKNVAKWAEKHMLPKFHDIRKIYPGEVDPNVKLFKIYQWIMGKDISSLELVSSLSMNASSDKMNTIIDKRMAETKRNKEYTKSMSIDRNMVIVYIPSQFTVGTSYKQHPSYPKLGHRIIYINTQNANIPFGKVGTVTGIYKSKIEVMFDEPFIGASNLCGRCNFFRGAVVNILEIFNLSEWKPFVNMKKDIAQKLEYEGPQAITEWDGKLNGFLLMDQILKIKEEAGQTDFTGFQLTSGPQKTEFTRKDYKDKKGRDKRGKNPNKKKSEKDDDTLLDAFGDIPADWDKKRDNEDRGDRDGDRDRDQEGEEGEYVKKGPSDQGME